MPDPSFRCNPARHMPAVTCARNGLNHTQHPLQHTHQHHSRNTPALPNHQHPRNTLPPPNTYPPRNHANATPPKPQARTRPQKTAPFTPNTHTNTNTNALGSDTPPQTSTNIPPAAAFIARHAPNHHNASHPSCITASLHHCITSSLHHHTTASPSHRLTAPPPPRRTASRHQNTTATQHHQPPAPTPQTPPVPDTMPLAPSCCLPPAACRLPPAACAINRMAGAMRIARRSVSRHLAKQLRIVRQTGTLPDIKCMALAAAFCREDRKDRS